MKKKYKTLLIIAPIAAVVGFVPTYIALSNYSSSSNSGSNNNLATVLPEGSDSFSDYNDVNLKLLTDLDAMKTYLSTNFNQEYLYPNESISNVDFAYVSDSLNGDVETSYYQFQVSATPTKNSYWDLDTKDNETKEFIVNYSGLMGLESSDLSFTAYNDYNLAYYEDNSELNNYLTSSFDISYLATENDLTNLEISYQTNSANITTNNVTFNIDVSLNSGYAWDDSTTEPKSFLVSNSLDYDVNVALTSITITQSDANLIFNDLSFNLRTFNEQLVVSGQGTATNPYEYQVDSLSVGSVTYNDSDFSDITFSIDEVSQNLVVNNFSVYEDSSSNSGYMGNLEFVYENITFNALIEVTNPNDNTISLDTTGSQTVSNSLFSVTKTIDVSKEWTTNNNIDAYNFGFRVLGHQTSVWIRQLSDGSMTVSSNFTKTDSNSWVGFVTYSFSEKVTFSNYTSSSAKTDGYLLYPTNSNEIATISYGSASDISDSYIAVGDTQTTIDWSSSNSGAVYELTENGIAWYGDTSGTVSSKSITIAASSDKNKIIISGAANNNGVGLNKATLELTDVDITITAVS